MLQSLFSSPNFPFYLLSNYSDEPFMKSFSDLCVSKQNSAYFESFKKYNWKSKNFINSMISKTEMTNFTNSLFKNKQIRFEKGRQDDAHELLVYLLSVLPFPQFDFKSETSLKWAECKHETFTIEAHNMVSVSISQSQSDYSRNLEVSSSQDLLNWWLQEEQISKSAGIICEKWGVTRDFSESRTAQAAPDELILHIKRFVFEHTKTFEFKVVKDNREIEVDSEVRWAGAKYNLYAVINHVGEFLWGHYTSEIKDKEGIWYSWDDDKVEAIDRTGSNGKSAYIMFYHKVEDE